MKNLKFIITSLFLYLISFGVVFGKALPPGTGIGDVPANVLILLDKSGSMGWRMSGGSSGINLPYDTTTDANGNLYIAQYRTYGIKKLEYANAKVDSSWGVNGTAHKGNCQTYYPYSIESASGVLYAISWSNRRIVKIRESDGACLGFISLGNAYPYNLSLFQNPQGRFIGVGTSQGYYLYDIDRGTSRNCNVNNQLRYAYMVGAADKNFSYMYSYRNSTIYRWQFDGNGCPSVSAGSKRYFYGNDFGGLTVDPNNEQVLYHLSWGQSYIRKITYGQNSETWRKGSRSTASSTTSATYFYYPWGISVDKTMSRIITTGLNKATVQSFDMNGNWLKNFGGAPQTRMQAAHEAIKAIVTDASLTSGVNFGFAYWAHGSSGFNNWRGDITTGNSSPCNNYNCLKVRVHKGGAARINQIISGVNPGGGTDAMAFMRIAQQYYNHNKFSPIDKNSPCQNSYALVIGDGDWYNHNNAKNAARNLRTQKYPVKTFAVAFGTGISSSGLRNFNELAKEGGTDAAIVAKTAAQLKSELKAAISQIIAQKLSFTAPAITATIESSGSLFQAQFDYRQNKEWAGTITRTAIDSNGNLNEKDKGNWSAADVMPSPDNRKIWSVGIPGTNYKSGYNNFTKANATNIGALFSLYKNAIVDFHNDSDSTNNRCANTAGVIDGNTDDQEGLIEFIRGKDYFDYEGECNLTETRTNPLGDIYHSQLVVVGPPGADTAFSGTNQEAYFRSINNYPTFATANKNRKEVIYAGSNSGILHAFDSKTGKELWGFVPPLVAPNLPLVMNRSLNKTKGGTNAVFGVDGSIVVHDMFFKSPLDVVKKWHTILMVPYGRGGAGFSVLDVTNPEKPLHLMSIYNDNINSTVYRIDHNENTHLYKYIARSYSLASFAEALEVTDRFSQDNNISNTCQDTRDGNGELTTSCYKSKSWTFPVRDISKSDIKVLFNDKKYTTFTVTKDANGETVLNFADDITYSADTGDSNTSSILGVSIVAGSKNTGVTTHPEYDYSLLGETWSDPRIFRIPNNGAGDTNIADDIYVAAMGGGYGTQFEGIGSNLTIVNLEDTTNPGSLYKRVEIEDTEASDIVNSTPSSAVLITPDTARGVTYSGGLLYLSDLEGKITKFNLTNMSDDGAGNNIKLFDQTTLFTAGSNKTNGRYMFHPMDATIGRTTNSLWLFAGTGDFNRINSTTTGTSNYLLGIRDEFYPLFRDVGKPATASDIGKCRNTTNDMPPTCLVKDTDKGWYIVLDNYSKVTAEPTVYKGFAYFPIYEPTKSVNKCSLGNAYICQADDECGSNNSSQLGTIRKGEACYYVGQGVLSKIVVFADKLFANIAGQSAGNKKDLVEIKSGQGAASSYRNSWKENF